MCEHGAVSAVCVHVNASTRLPLIHSVTVGTALLMGSTLGVMVTVTTALVQSTADILVACRIMSTVLSTIAPVCGTIGQTYSPIAQPSARLPLLPHTGRIIDVEVRVVNGIPHLQPTVGQLLICNTRTRVKEAMLTTRGLGLCWSARAGTYNSD